MFHNNLGFEWPGMDFACILAGQCVTGQMEDRRTPFPGQCPDRVKA